MAPKNHEKRIAIEEGALLAKYLRQVVGEPADSIAFDFVDLPDARPFLSVLIRTQGRRIKSLNEVLDCLSKQSVEDFEILLLGHRMGSEEEKEVRSVVENQAESLREKIRYIKVDYGNRTAPLNVGFENALGKYISILDDDDLVYDFWVETFRDLYKQSPGAVLHSYVYKQDWESKADEAGEQELTAVGDMEDMFCMGFEWARQFMYNRCPSFSLAFPRNVFFDFGLRFDEGLTTTEDYDFLMRAVFIVGIVDSDRVTGVYRFWKNTENASSLHDEHEWLENEEYIFSKWGNAVFLAPQNAANSIRFYVQELLPGSYKYMRQALLFIDDGSGFNEGQTVKGELTFFQNQFDIEYHGFEKYNSIQKLRWDPTMYGKFFIDRLKVCLMYEDGTEYEVSQSGKYNNSLFVYEGMYCMGNDPQAVFRLLRVNGLIKVRVEGAFFDIFPDIIVDKLSAAAGTSGFSRKLIAFVKRFLYFIKRQDN